MNNFPLVTDPKEQQALWDQITNALLKYESTLKDLPVAPPAAPEEVQELLSPFTFEQPMEGQPLIDFVVHGLTQHQLHVRHPSYYGVFNPNPSFWGVAGETLSAAFNSQLASSTSSLFGVLVEQHLINFFARLMHYQPAEGCFTSGGTEANHTAVLTALTRHFPEFSKKGIGSHKPTLYVSTEAHHSFLKAARMCGLGTEAVREIGVGSDLTFRIDLLQDRIDADRRAGFEPFFLVGTIGTTSAGTIDPISDLCTLAERERLWLHTDAAWGGAAALLPEYRELFEAVGKTDSTTLDAHKWFSTPMSAGLFLTRHRGILERTFRVEESPYMPQDSSDRIQEPYSHSMSWSRRFIGLKLFMTLSRIGISGYRKVLSHQIEMGKILRHLLQEQGWTVVNQTELPVVCFTDASVNPHTIAQHLATSGRAWITTTKLTANSQTVLRAGISNHCTTKEDLKELVSLLSIARAARSSLP